MVDEATETQPDAAQELPPGVELREIEREDEPLAEQALALIAESFAPRERQPLGELRSEIEEKRLGLLQPFDYHLLVAVEEGRVSGAVAGVYLAGVNAGFITYLAVGPDERGKGLGIALRSALTGRFEADARRADRAPLAWVLGEVRRGSGWVGALVRKRGAIVFDLDYYHPGVQLDGPHEPYALYREPVGDQRATLPAAQVRQLLYAIWRRAYRVRYPLEREGFRRMLRQLEGADEVGPADLGDTD